jgi:hypothetical protein
VWEAGGGVAVDNKILKFRSSVLSLNEHISEPRAAAQKLSVSDKGSIPFEIERSVAAP